MFTCKVCGSEVERGQAYCATCGAEVVANYEVKCPACGTRNNAGSRFCAHCGEMAYCAVPPASYAARKICRGRNSVPSAERP